MSGSDPLLYPPYRGRPGRSAQGPEGRGLSLAGLAMRQLALRRGWTTFLVLSLTVCFALATALPVAATMAADAALRAAVNTPGDQARLTVARQGVTDQSAFESTEAALAGRVEGRLGRYLASSSALATLGPLTPASINESRPPTGTGSGGLAVGYLRDLPDRVELVAGSVPADGLGGSTAIAATMAQTEADSLGLHLGDRMCLDFASGGGRWCARVAGLWRPLQSGDPFRLEAGRRVALVVGRYDFYRLMKLAGSQGATVGRQFYVDAGALDSRDAADVVSGLRELRAYFSARGELFDTSLDRVIDGLQTRQLTARLAAQLLVVGLGALVVYTGAFGVGHVLQLQWREVGLVRARGWPARRVKRLLMLQVAVVVVVALLLGCGAAALGAIAAGPALLGLPPPGRELPDPGNLTRPLLAAAAGLALLWGALSAVAGRTARSASRLSGGPAEAGVPAGRGGAATGWMVLVLGIALLAVLRACQGVPGLPRLLSRPGLAVDERALDTVLAVSAVVALLLLVTASVRSLPLVGSLAARSGSGVPANLARWQLERRPDQHRQLAFLLTLAVALAVFGGMAATSGPHERADLPLAAALLGGGAAALVVAVLAFALHFRAAARARAEEYAALLLSGLPGRTLRKSLAMEERAVAWHGLLFGCLLGAALALALLPPWELGAAPLRSAIVLGALLLGFVTALLVAARIARGWLGRVDAAVQVRRVLT
jgi:hypothetical protein